MDAAMRPAYVLNPSWEERAIDRTDGERSESRDSARLHAEAALLQKEGEKGSKALGWMQPALVLQDWEIADLSRPCVLNLQIY